MLFRKSHLKRRVTSCSGELWGLCRTYNTARWWRKTGSGRRREEERRRQKKNDGFSPGGDADEQDPKTRCRCLIKKKKKNKQTAQQMFSWLDNVSVLITWWKLRYTVTAFCTDNTEWERCFETTEKRGLQDHPEFISVDFYDAAVMLLLTSSLLGKKLRRNLSIVCCLGC